MAGGAVIRYVRRAVRSDGGKAAPSPSSSDLPISYGCLETEEWEFDGDEGGEFSGEFESLPTQQEVQEATSDLQDALTRVVYPFSGSQDCETGSSSNTVQQSADLLVRSTSLETEKTAEERSASLETENTAEDNPIGGNQPVLHPINSGMALHLGHNDVFDAFRLLQTNPAIQEVVISLASDKAIWDALLKNERVREFRQLLQRGNSELHEITEDSDGILVGEPNIFIRAGKNAKMKLMDYMEKITELARVIFGFVDKMFGEKAGEALNKTLKSSLFLSIVILLVVVVKRTFKMVCALV